MPRRFSNAPLKSTDPASSEKLNPLFVKLDAAVAALEEVKLLWDEQVLLFNTNALRRVTDAVAPLIAQINTAIDGGFLVAQTDDLVEIVDGEEVNFFIPEGARIAFRPTPFLAILAPDEREDWAIGRLLAYSDNTGLLTVEILHLNGSGAERTGWTIAASSGVVEAVHQWMGETKTARDLAVAKAAAALASAADAAASAAAALASQGAAATSATQAGSARTSAQGYAQNAFDSAAAAAASAASIAGGPVTSVNGHTGIVTGLAEASAVLAAFVAQDAAIALKADAAAMTTALDAKAPQASTYTKTEVDTAVGRAVSIASTLKYAGWNQW